MVKKWIVMISISILLIVGCIVESKYVHSSFSWLINSLETLQIEIKQEKEKIDNQKNLELAYDIHNEWHKKVKILKC